MTQPIPLPLRHFAVGISLALAGAACGSKARTGGASAGDWVAQVDTIADTITVRTVRGGGWGTATLVEELRIGKADGTEDETFGRISALAVAPGGDIFAYDEQSNAIRRFGADGTDLGRVGRSGSGPGEYRSIAGMTVMDDGRLVAHDFGNRRFNFYGPDGTFITSWLLTTQVAEQRPLYKDSGRVILYDRVLLGEDPERTGLLMPLDQGGQATDTIVMPTSDFESPFLHVEAGTIRTGAAVPFGAIEDWSVTSGGALVTMRGDRYAIDVHGPDGMVHRITRDIDAVRVSEEERTVEEARVTARLRRVVPTWSWSGPGIPNTKPPISWLHTGEGDRIWVRVAQPGVPLPEAERLASLRSHVTEPVVFDVYESSGRFLGQVRAPDALRLSPHPVLGTDRVWGVVTDADGVQYIARFRIERP